MVNSTVVCDWFYYSPFTIHHLLVFRHHFFTTLENLSHHALLRHGEYFQTICASLFQLFTLHVGHLRQMSLGPGVFNELKRIIFSERMPLPVRRQKYSSQVGMVVEIDTEEIVDFALHPVCRGPNAGDAVNARDFCD